MSTAPSGISPQPSEQLALTGVTVRYGSTVALDDISVSFGAGEIVGVLGHNGAGKSTLVKVASGAVRPGSGSLRIGGEEISAAQQNPRGLGERGLSVVNQEPSLAGSLTVWENIVLTESPKTRPSKARVTEVLAQIGLNASADQPVHTLSLGERQLLSIAKSLVLERSEVLLLDEPTAALGLEETEVLHQLIQRLADSGTTVLYVSHRLTDVMNITTRIVVLREGRIVADQPTDELTLAKVHDYISPGLVVLSEREESHELGEVVMERYGIAVRAGEILGLYGMAGGRQFDVLESFYMDPEHATSRQIRESLRTGVTLLPADREQHALLPSQDALTNMMLPWLQQFTDVLGVRNGALRERYQESRKTLNVQGPGFRSPITAFSGGNKQKHVVARTCLQNESKVVLLAQPTQGVDVAARLDIARVVKQLAASGVAVIVASAEADEIELFCQRSWVMDKSEKVLIERSENFGSELTETLLKVL